MEKRCLSGNALKILAMIFMTCDHVAVELLPDWDFLRIIGRLAMPIYAYMIAEGCRFTHDRKKYLWRLSSLALLCQVVYFYAVGSLYQCILVTFSLSVCLIWALETSPKSWGLLVFLASAFLCEGLPVLLKGTDFAVDYGIVGVCLPALVYFGRTREEKLLGFTVGLVLLALQYGGIQWFGLGAVPLLMLYSGERGKLSIGRLFYFYYPAHLVVIYGLSLLL
ncbi:MAG TPA: hypothetical protein IAC17_04725 [Candidatus Faecousia faecipullorum]|nr:hypothetical protein [Candidatus Faecousia faecipullorum]